MTFEHDGQYASAKRRAKLAAETLAGRTDDGEPPSTKDTDARTEEPHRHY